MINRLNSYKWSLIVIACLLTACVSTPQPLSIQAEVDALASQQALNKRRFVILPGNSQTNAQDLQFLEFKGYVEQALIRRGYLKVDSLQEGEMVLFLNYGVGEPQMRQQSYDVPIWYDSAFYPYGRRFRYGYPRMPYGVGGYAQRFETYTVYRRFLTLEAYDMAAYLQQQAPLQLWKSSVQSFGQSNDLRLTFPFMVAAVQPYLGSNTGYMLNVEIQESDPLLKDILQANPYRLPAAVTAEPPH